MNFSTFINQSTGSWESERKYLYFNRDGSKKREMEVTTKFDISLKDDPNGFLIEWISTQDTERKSMLFTYTSDPSIIIRNKGYWTDNNVETKVDMVRSNMVKLISSYNNQVFEETIELKRLAGKLYRIRSMIATNQGTGLLELVGRYFETRVKL